MYRLTIGTNTVAAIVIAEPTCNGEFMSASISVLAFIGDRE